MGLLGGLAYSFYKVRYTPPTYSVNSRMLVKDEYSSWGQEYFLPGMELVSGRNRLVNEIGIIQSSTVMSRVAKQLDISYSYHKVGVIKTTELYPNGEFSIELEKGSQVPGNFYIDFPEQGAYRYGSSEEEMKDAFKLPIEEPITLGESTYLLKVHSNSIYGEDYYNVNINATNELARHLQGAIQIDLENQESSILLLSHQGRTPAKSIDYLNVLMREYIQWGKDENNQITTNTIAFVDHQLREIADSLVITEHRLEQFQKKNFKDRIFVQEESNNMDVVFELEDALTQRSVQKEYYSALIKSVEQDEFTAFPSAAVFGFQDPNVDGMIGVLVDAVKAKSEAAFANTSNSAFFQRKTAAVEAGRKGLLEVAKMNRLQVVALIDSLKGLISREEQKVLKIPKEQREYFKLLRENKLLTDLYTFLLNKRSEASIAKASNVAKAQILDLADAHRVLYIGPKTGSIYGTGILTGLAIPLAVIFLFYVMNTKIVNSSDLDRLTSIPVLGSVMLKKGLNNNLIVANSLKSVMAEAFRSIRTKLNFMTVGGGCTKILVTSSISGEGKTFTSINLAAIYAASGKKTVLLGADLRKPKIFKDFDLKNDVGLSTYLIRKATLVEVVQPTRLDNLDLISSGPIPPNPAELIESDAMRDLFEELELKYDLIIIDSPPLGLVTDALLLKDYADAALYIVRHNYTRKSYLENINQLYVDKVFTNVGIVVNAVQQKSNFGYGNSYGYGYGYGYGYYSEDSND
jgi:tyrosine-protein kinase Etk/Wzc